MHISIPLCPLLGIHKCPPPKYPSGFITTRKTGTHKMKAPMPLCTGIPTEEVANLSESPVWFGGKANTSIEFGLLRFPFQRAVPARLFICT